VNNKCSIILLIFTLVFLIGCEPTQKNNFDQEFSLDFESQYIRTDGYTDGVSYPITFLINSNEEMNEYYMANKDTYNLQRQEKVYSDTTIGFLDAVDKYNDDYFKDKVLVFVLLEEGSGSTRHVITDVKHNENYVEIVIKKIVPEVGTEDMAQWHIMVELERETYNDFEIKIIFE